MESNKIVVDLSNILIAHLMNNIGSTKHDQFVLDLPMLRHTVLNQIRSIRVKFKGEYPETVIACDGSSSWRKNVFPYYKAARRENREASSLDWNSIFSALNMIRDEISETFPYACVLVNEAEADDVIGVLAREAEEKDFKLMIVATDKDFKQLHGWNVQQYDPIKKKVFRENSPEEFLIEHVIRGDRGDGVPNVLSSDDCFVMKKRQGVLSQKRYDDVRSKMINEHSTLSIKDASEEITRNTYRNITMIDLRRTPLEISEKILKEYESQKNKQPGNIMSYMMKNRLKELTASVTDFY